MIVLLTDGNERATLAATRALGASQVRVVVASEAGRSLAAASKYCWKSVTYPSPFDYPQGYISRLLELIKADHVDVVFPMTDIAMQLIGGHKDEFDKMTVVPMPSVDIYETLSDKYRLMQLAQRLGVPIPQTIFVPNGNIKCFLDDISRFPVVVKPARSLTHINGRWCKTGVQYAESKEALCRLYDEHEFLQQPSMVQQRIEGRGQGVFALMQYGKPIGLFAHQRLRERPPSGGVSVLSESIPLPQSMTDYALRLLQHVGWHGVGMVEFKIDEASGKPALIEINGRFWGSLQLAIDAGMNFPIGLYRMAIGEQVESSMSGYKYGVKSRWLLGDLDHLFLRLFKPAYLPPCIPSKFKCVLDFCRLFEAGMRYDVLRASDPKPFAYEMQQYLAHLL
jgi:predicted ATP-grasp superfamily ATP-dependent carboligase